MSRLANVIRSLRGFLLVTGFIFVSLSLKTALAELYGYIMPPLLISKHFENFLDSYFLKYIFKFFKDIVLLVFFF